MLIQLQVTLDTDGQNAVLHSTEYGKGIPTTTRRVVSLAGGLAIEAQLRAIMDGKDAPVVEPEEMVTLFAWTESNPVLGCILNAVQERKNIDNSYNNYLRLISFSLPRRLFAPLQAERVTATCAKEEQ